MNSFFQVTGAVLIAVILGLSLNKNGKDFSVVLILLVSCMVMTVMTAYFEPIIDFVEEPAFCFIDHSLLCTNFQFHLFFFFSLFPLPCFCFGFIFLSFSSFLRQEVMLLI